jgi:2-oxoglutarate dehydrogenase E2 component (dihydrolipoamide succinyltransferase)
MVKAILEFPMVNVSLDGTDIIVKKDINVGLATMLPDGNLIVPVIRNADRMNLAGLAAMVNDLAERAREGKLLPHEIKGGTITLTNLGMFGNLTGIPIINQPESAIIAIGSILKKPAVITTKGVPGIAIRDICVLSMSYDHRIIDGALGGSFLARVASFLENYIPEEKLI